MSSMLALDEGTGPVPATTTSRPARRRQARRVLHLAALKRQGRRRTTHIKLREPRVFELPLAAILAGGVGIVAMTLALCGWVVTL